MIMPMKKVSLVVMEKTRENSLTKLRELGLVHLERRNVSSESLSKLLDRKAKIESALGILRPYEAEAKKANKGAGEPVPPPGQNPRRRAADLLRPEDAFYSADAVVELQRPDLVALILEYADERKSLQDRAAVLSKERSRIEDWGDFKSGDFAALEERGIKLIPYKLSAKSFASLSQEIPFLKLGEDKNSVYILSLGRDIPGETPFALPESSLQEIGGQLEQIRRQAADIEKRLLSLASRTPILETEGKALLTQIEFETARLGMDSLEEVSPEWRVAWISGFVPQEDLGRLKRAAAENSWALAAGDPGPEDQVPTKLKNNRLASLIRPLTDFLEVVPGYNEVDISGWFLLFFVIFFGMIFGDAGYGALILLACTFGMIKTAKKGIPPVLKLLLLLGLSNFTWGLLSCSWFGLKSAQIPGFLQNLSLPLISNVTADRSAFDKAIVQQNLMILCFSLALLQLSIGHLLAIAHERSLKILGHIGNIAMLGGMYFIILSLIASNEARQIPLYPSAIYVFAAGFALNFVFAAYEGSIGRSILESLKNIISVILGIANVFSDIMSYIRLWAVGLAGAAIADTVDTMAAQIGGIAGPVAVHFAVFVLAVVLLVFGHGLNLILNVLSVLVHGVRLNTLEFSGHVGLSWSGIAYKPFADTAIRSHE
jgi:V/A-type H+-transporting ATPase subunit I